MLGQHWVGPMSEPSIERADVARFTRTIALVMGLAVAFVLGSSMHRAGSERLADAHAVARFDAHDLRALGLGSAPWLAGQPVAPRRAPGSEHAARHVAAAEASVPAPVEAPLQVRRLPVLDTEQQNIARFIARRYRVAIEQTQYFVEYAYRSAREFKVDPWLILAVISVESSFDPRAESQQGAQGLMQVLTRVHAEKFKPFGGVAAAFDPLANIKVGAQILKEYLGRDGTVEGALKAYVGAALLPDDGGYGAKVLGERERIAAAAKGRPDPLEQAARRARTEAAAAATESGQRSI